MAAFEQPSSLVKEQQTNYTTCSTHTIKHSANLKVKHLKSSLKWRASSFSAFDWNASVAENTSKFKSILDEMLADAWVDVEGNAHELVWNDNAKAHILRMSFNNANENFYELEDSGDMEDRFIAQDDFLEAIENALKHV